LRLLSTSYTGDAIEVRRASDNATQDIGFVNNELDVTSLESFCSGTNGFVTTWYDQSGNGRDATQTTAASQPQIVSSGSVITENGKPAAQFDGSDDYHESNANYTQPFTYFILSKSNSSTSDRAMIDGSSGTNFVQLKYYNQINKFILFAGAILEGETFNTNQNLHYALYDGISSEIGLNNNTEILGNAGTNDPTSVTIGSRLAGTGQFWDGNIQELILYPSDQSSNRTGIETNINDFYSIYYVATNSEYQDVLDYADSQGYQRPSYAQQALQDALVGDLKDAGVWSKLDLFYVFPTDGDSDFASINWKDPNDYEITEVNSPTFTTNVGFTGNGTSALLYTNFNPLTDRVNYDPKGGDGQRFVWVGDTGSNGVLISDEPVGSGGALDRMRLNNTGSGSNKIMTTSGGLSSALSGSGLWYTEFDGTNRSFYLNDTFVQSVTSSATTDAYKTNWQLLGDSVYYDGNIKFHGIGSLLSATEQTDLYNALDTYNSSL
jgi:hypothetical protein